MLIHQDSDQVVLQRLEHATRTFEAVDDIAAVGFTHTSEISIYQRVFHRFGNNSDRIAEGKIA